MPPRSKSINPTQPPGGNGHLRVRRDNRVRARASRRPPAPTSRLAAAERRGAAGASVPWPHGADSGTARGRRERATPACAASERTEAEPYELAAVTNEPRGRVANERDGKSRGAGGGSGGGDSVSPLKGARAATWRWERGACLPPPRPRAARGGGQRGARPALAWATRGGGSARRGPARQQPRQRAAARGARGRGPPGGGSGGGGGMARPAEAEWQRAEVGAGPRGRAGPSLRWRPGEAKRGAGGPGGGAPRARARSLGAAVGAEVGGRALGRRARSLGGSEPSRGGPGPGLPRGGAQCACARPALPAARCAPPRSAGRRRAAPR